VVKGLCVRGWQLFLEIRLMPLRMLYNRKAFPFIDSFQHTRLAISWSGCQEPAICDAWPPQAQECLESDCFASNANQEEFIRSRYGPETLDNPHVRGTLDQRPTIVLSMTFTRDDYGRDIISEAFKHRQLHGIVVPSSVNRPSPEQVDNFFSSVKTPAR
jgi:hypothetical protein